MIWYKGEFTARDNDKDLPALLEIYTAERPADAAELKFPAEPAVLTWESEGLLGVIHGAQLRVNLLALDDGQYRDIMETDGPVYCTLSIDKGNGYERWWTGVYASRTWGEPFSRERNYSLQLTFSDFGYLDRVDFRDLDSSISNGRMSIAAFLWQAVSLFLGISPASSANPLIEEHPMVMSWFRDYRFRQLYMLDNMMYDSDGEPRPFREILQDILEPANIHIKQYDGKVHLYNPDVYMSEDSSRAISLSMTAADTDAQMETCEAYRRIDIDYQQSSSSLYSNTPDDSEMEWSGDYADYSDGYDGSKVVAISDNYIPEDTRLFLGVSSAGAVMTVLMADTSIFFSGGRSAFIPTQISGIRTAELPAPAFNVAKTPSFSVKSYGANISVSVFTVFDRSDADFGLIRVELPVTVTFRSAAKTLYLSQSTAPFSQNLYFWTEDQSQVNPPSMIIANEQPDKTEAPTLKLTMGVPSTDETGRIEMTIDYAAIKFYDANKTLGQSGYESKVSTVRFLGLTAIEVTASGFMDRFLTYAERIRRDIATTANDELTKSFAMGTPKIISVGTRSAFFPATGEAELPADETYLSRYAAFLERNYAIDTDRPQRMLVNGAYRYTHILGLPVFIPELCVPLKTISGKKRAFFIRTEQWSIRKGVASLEIEEADASLYDAYPGAEYILVSPSVLDVGNDGGPVRAMVQTNAARWAFVDNGVVTVVPREGTADGEVEVSVPANNDGYPKTYTCDLDFNTPGTRRIVIRQAAAPEYLTLTPTVLELGPDGNSEDVDVSTNFDGWTVSSSPEWVEATRVSSSRLTVRAASSLNGRNDLPRTGGIVTVQAQDRSAQVEVSQKALGLVCAISKPETTITIDPAGGTLSVIAASNAKTVDVSVLGLMTIGKEFTVTCINTGTGEQTVLGQTTGTALNGLVIPGDIGLTGTYLLAITCDIPANSSGSQKGSIIRVTGYGESVSVSDAVAAYQNFMYKSFNKSFNKSFR